ncbi:MAG: SDR family NAD(P)-dependent oxidoreductase [Pseudomonadota bacterium]
MDKRDNQTRTALVTGAGKRLGRAIALSLAEDGYDVALHYNTSRQETEAVRGDVEALGRKAILVEGDLGDPSKAEAIVQQALTLGGSLSLLINSASYYDSDTLRTLTMASWQKLINVNLAAQVFMMQAFAQQPSIPQGASVVNMLDQQITTPSPQFFSYFTAKIGLEGATRLAAFELAPAIRVNGIAPGLVLPSWGQSQDEFESRQAMMPLGVGLGADDIVGAIRYFATASHVTGQVLFTDSGQRLIGIGNSDLILR